MTKDFELKIRLHNILWSLGYATRLEVKLAQYGAATSKPLELTDVDVLGLRVEPDLATRYALGDCTTRKAAGIERAFWLKGILQHFGGDRGYLVLGTDKEIDLAHRAVAESLGLSILNLKGFVSWEERIVDEHTKMLKLADPAMWQEFEAQIQQMPKDIEPLRSFRKYGYWILPHHRRIPALIARLSRHHNLLDPRSKVSRGFAVDCLGLLGLSVLQMSSRVLPSDLDDAQKQMRAYFFGGYNELRNREEIAKKMNVIMQTISQAQIGIFEEDIKLDPDYLPKLFDLSFRFLSRPRESSMLPRYLQVVLFERVLNEGKDEHGMKYLSVEFPDVTKKFTHDLAVFASEATGMSMDLFPEV